MHTHLLMPQKLCLYFTVFVFVAPLLRFWRTVFTTHSLLFFFTVYDFTSARSLVESFVLYGSSFCTKSFRFQFQLFYSFDLLICVLVAAIVAIHPSMPCHCKAIQVMAHWLSEYGATLSFNSKINAQTHRIHYELYPIVVKACIKYVIFIYKTALSIHVNCGQTDNWVLTSSCKRICAQIRRHFACSFVPKWLH